MGCGGGSHLRSAEGERPIDLLGAVPDGAITVVRLAPGELFANEGMAALLRVVVPEKKERFLGARYGIELSRAQELVWADYGAGEIVLARLAGSAEDVVRTAERAMLVERRIDEPWLRRGGLAAGKPQEVVALRSDVVAIGTGDLGPLFRALDRERLAASGRAATGGAFAGSLLGELLAAHRDAPIALFRPLPLALPSNAPVAILLARERALAVSVRAVARARATVTIDVRGEFPQTAKDNFRMLVQAVAQAGFGRVFGLDEYAATLEIAANDDRVLLTGSVSSERVAKGLRTAFVAELPDLVRLLSDD